MTLAARPTLDEDTETAFAAEVTGLPVEKVPRRLHGPARTGHPPVGRVGHEIA